MDKLQAYRYKKSNGRLRANAFKKDQASDVSVVCKSKGSMVMRKEEVKKTLKGVLLPSGSIG
jgi:predicted secreted protein